MKKDLYSSFYGIIPVYKDEDDDVLYLKRLDEEEIIKVHQIDDTVSKYVLDNDDIAELYEAIRVEVNRRNSNKSGGQIFMFLVFIIMMIFTIISADIVAVNGYKIIQICGGVIEGSGIEILKRVLIFAFGGLLTFIFGGIASASFETFRGKIKRR